MRSVAFGLAILLATGTAPLGAEAAEEDAVEVQTTTETADEAADEPTPELGPTEAPPAPAAGLPGGSAPVVVQVRAAEKSAGRAKVFFRNDVSDRYDLVEVRFVMNGRELPARLTNPERGKSYAIYEGTVDPGRQVVTAHLTYQGKSRGPFTYMKGYRFKVSSDQVLTTPAGRNVSFTIVGKEGRGLTASAATRLAVTVEENAAR
jgi:hypothetical protein